MVKIKSLKDWLLHFGGRAKIGFMTKIGGDITYLKHVDDVKLILVRKGDSFIIINNKRLYTVYCSKRGRLEVALI